MSAGIGRDACGDETTARDFRNRWIADSRLRVRDPATTRKEGVIVDGAELESCGVLQVKRRFGNGFE